MNFGKNLTLIRKSKGISQEELANIVGVSRQTMYTWEADLAYPNVVMLKRLADILSTTIDDLVSGFDVNKLPRVLPKFELEYISKSKDSIAYKEMPNWFVELRDGDEVNFALYDNGIKDYSYHLSVVSKIILHGQEGYEIAVDEYSEMGCKESTFVLIGQLDDEMIRYLGRIDTIDGKKIISTFKDKTFIKNWGMGENNSGRSIIFNDVEIYNLKINDTRYPVKKISYLDSDTIFVEVYLDEENRTILWKRYDLGKDSGEVVNIDGKKYGLFYQCITDRLR
ncbi:MAG: helix-turn-helix transcriptional regulator [Bacilli bacterium]|jgi:transcriptional regulator with XRE-family HTH domain